MKQKHSAEFREFDKVMGNLLAVPYSELQQKLDEEKRTKAKQEKEPSYFAHFRPRFFIPKEASSLVRR